MILWSICLAISIIAVVASVLYCYRPKAKGKVFYTMMIGTAVGSFFSLFPALWEEYAGETLGLWQTFCATIFQTLTYFFINGNYSILIDASANLPTMLMLIYRVWASLLFLAAPIMTLGCVLSLFGSLLEKIRLRRTRGKELFVFSKLTDNAVILAKDLKKNNRDCVIVFSGISEEPAENELAAEAKHLNAIMLKSDIADIDLKFLGASKSGWFLMTGTDETEHVLTLTEKYGARENIGLIFFADGMESSMLLGAIDTADMKMRVFRRNVPQDTVYRRLYDHGNRIFDSAFDGEEKQIRVLLVGLGSVGKEYLKALSWYCQMPGYNLCMDAFGTEHDCRTLQKACPELFDARLNGKTIEGESQYCITLHSTDEITLDALEACAKLQPTYVFIDLDDDTQNVEAVVSIRTELMRNGVSPVMDAVVRAPKKNALLQNMGNMKQQSYNIQIIGSDCETYSEQNVFHFDLEEKGLARHMFYCSNANFEQKQQEEKKFWRYEYNYRSSIASAIHQKAKAECKIPGTDKAVSCRTEEELWALRILEHKRWNAYMRSEGYCYAPVRNDLSKQHPCLVPFSDLPLSEQIKDDI